jgi:hypothetical protein
MPYLWHREVDNYTADVFESTTLNYNRAIRLSLKAGTDPAHTVSLQFPSSLPSDWVSIGTSFSTIQMAASRFDTVYHLLQTEKPIYFTAYEFDSLRFAGLTTDPEHLGEGFRDSDAGL